MAQVMYFWKYPGRGQGSHSYVWNNRTLYADFNHPYRWDRMRSSYSRRYTGEQADAVARLMSDVGIAIDMDYGLDGSYAWANDNNAFLNFFKYSQDVHWIFRSDVASWAAWFNILKQQMDIRQPAILSVYKPGSGHAIVADGYRTSPSNQIHVNMGWGGYADNYYTVANIYGYGDAESDRAVIDIHPTQFITLNISASLGGTTNPAPGTYTYEDGAYVQVRALPAQYCTFMGWSGDASGKANPETIYMNRDKSVTADFKLVNPPSNLTAVRLENRSVTQTEYIVDLRWNPNPANDKLTIVSYRVYQKVGNSRVKLADLSAAERSYRHRMVPKAEQTYGVTSVSDDGGESKSVTVTK
jgi:hypothetical protein